VNCSRPTSCPSPSKHRACFRCDDVNSPRPNPQVRPRFFCASEKARLLRHALPMPRLLQMGVAGVERQRAPSGANPGGSLRSTPQVPIGIGNACLNNRRPNESCEPRSFDRNLHVQAGERNPRRDRTTFPPAVTFAKQPRTSDVQERHWRNASGAQRATTRALRTPCLGRRIAAAP
jgi:hypothetical protein